MQLVKVKEHLIVRKGEKYTIPEYSYYKDGNLKFADREGNYFFTAPTIVGKKVVSPFHYRVRCFHCGTKLKSNVSEKHIRNEVNEELSIRKDVCNQCYDIISILILENDESKRAELLVKWISRERKNGN